MSTKYLEKAEKWLEPQIQKDSKQLPYTCSDYIRGTILFAKWLDSQKTEELLGEDISPDGHHCKLFGFRDKSGVVTVTREEFTKPKTEECKDGHEHIRKTECPGSYAYSSTCFICGKDRHPGNTATLTGIELPHKPKKLEKLLFEDYFHESDELSHRRLLNKINELIDHINSL